MAMYELKNENLSICVCGKGAELKSLKEISNGREYMWNANPEFWPRTSPVLFPFVGRLKGQKYDYLGKSYTPPVHGFARDMEFELWEKTEDTLVFGIRDTEDTKAVYPFSFSFQITYRLTGRNLDMTYTVKNEGGEEMFFSLGAHPGFKCPLGDVEEEKRSDCFLFFEKEGPVENLYSRGVDMETGLVNDLYTKYTTDNGFLPIADDLFKQDALVLEKSQVTRVSLADAAKKPYLTLTMDAPVYGIWSSVKTGAPFICIEPWFGRCDATGFEGGLEEREYQNRLDAGGVFETTCTITIA